MLKIAIQRTIFLFSVGHLAFGKEIISTSRVLTPEWWSCPACDQLTSKKNPPFTKKYPPYTLLPCLTSPHPHWVPPSPFSVWTHNGCAVWFHTHRVWWGPPPRCSYMYARIAVMGGRFPLSSFLTSTGSVRPVMASCLVLFALSWKPFGDGLNALSHRPAVFCIELSSPCSLTSRLYMRFTPGSFFVSFSFCSSGPQSWSVLPPPCHVPKRLCCVHPFSVWRCKRHSKVHKDLCICCNFVFNRSSITQMSMITRFDLHFSAAMLKKCGPCPDAADAGAHAAVHCFLSHRAHPRSGSVQISPTGTPMSSRRGRQLPQLPPTGMDRGKSAVVWIWSFVDPTFRNRVYRYLFFRERKTCEAVTFLLSSFSILFLEDGSEGTELCEGLYLKVWVWPLRQEMLQVILKVYIILQ